MRKAALVAIGVLGSSGLLLAATSTHTKTIRFNEAQDVPGDSSTVKGSSVKLTRTSNSVSIRVNTTELPAGAYTNWWVVFNNPAACGADGCNSGDFGNADVEASVFWATGGVVDHSNVGHFRAHLAEGAPPSPTPGQHLFGPGLLDALAAEIHYIIRYHGPVVESILIDQITTVWGGCVPGPAPGPEPYPCYDPQAAVTPNLTP
jgi:hypothetical protein